MAEYEYHKLCQAFPMMSKEELQQLGEDIRDNGQRFGVFRWHGLIIDGKNRIEACKLVGVDPIIVDKEDKLETEADVIRLIYSANLVRRQLSASVKAALAVELMKAIEEADKEDKKSKKEVVEEAAKTTGVSTSYVKAAEQVEKEDPEKFEQVKAGKKSVAKAAKEIRAEAGEDADDAAVLRKAEKVVEKCQQKLGELGYRLVDDTLEAL